MIFHEFSHSIAIFAMLIPSFIFAGRPNTNILIVYIKIASIASENEMTMLRLFVTV